MIAIWYLLMLAPVIALPILWWNYRSKVQQRESDSGARWDQLAYAAKQGVAGQLIAAPTTAPGAGSVPAAGASPYARRTRALDPVETLVFLLLTNALPDHEVMPRVALNSVLYVSAGLTGTAREQAVRELKQQVVDFMICNKAMRPVAVIDLRTAPATPDFRIRCLQQAGINYLQVARTALPKRDAVRKLVLGVQA